MRSKHDQQDYSETDLRIEPPKDHAAGVPAVAVSMQRALSRMGPVRTAKTLLKVNQAEGFDCMSCAWPDPEVGHRHTAEFCENGAKAVAEEATRDRADPAFFAAHSVADLDGRSEHWLGQQGRITHPMVKRPGATHYQAIDWDEAFELIGAELRSLDSPDEAIFYTSGRASNESAFSYQLFARAFGTNNLPDCSNMCHESTSIALQESIGIGKASVSIEDVYNAKLIIIAGQNPGTNHPRMLSALEIAKKNGAKIVSINPLREADLVQFSNPQDGSGGLRGAAPTWPISICRSRSTVTSRCSRPSARCWSSGTRSTTTSSIRTRTGSTLGRLTSAPSTGMSTPPTGLSRALITEAAQLIADSPATVYCWAMGLTQHRNSVATIKEIANLAFARGDIGKPGAGLLPVRGHSNVQGDRTMGIWERPPQHFLDGLQAEFGFDPPREHGYDTVDSIRALRDGKAHVFLGLGGNFVQAAPDTDVMVDALRRARMTVHVSTKINRSHLVCGETALILPTLGRTEKDVQASGEQFVSVEDSTCSVHASRGPLEPASAQLRSEVAIVTGIAERTLGDRSRSRLAGDAGRLPHHPDTHLPGGAGLRDVRGVGRPTRWLGCCPTRRGTPGPSRPPPDGPSSSPRRSRCCRSATASGAADPA